MRAPSNFHLRSFRVTIYHGPDQWVLLEEIIFGDTFASTCHRCADDRGCSTRLRCRVPMGMHVHPRWRCRTSAGKRWCRISRDDRCRSAGADARWAVRARDRCREGENRANRCDYSVARCPFPLLDDEETIKQFPRVLWDHELPAVGAKDHFVFRDLIAVRAPWHSSSGPRIALVDSGRVLEQFPASFEGLRERYEQARRTTNDTAPCEAARSNFRHWWWPR